MSVTQPKSYGEGRTVLFPVDKVKVDREARQRRTLDRDVQVLAEQILTAGRLIHPITLKKDGTLVAGERRLEAHKLLGWPDIRAQFFEELSYEQGYLIELLENVARQNLSWQDEVSAVSKYHKMKIQTVGPMWTIKGTATDLGWKQSTVQKYLEISKHLDDDEVFGAATIDGAFNLIRGRAERARAAAANRGLSIAKAAITLPSISPAASPEEKGAALASLLKTGNLDLSKPRDASSKEEADLALIEAGRVAEESLRLAAEQEEAERAAAASSPIITADFIQWIEQYEGPAFDVLHVDFPYGKNYQGSNTRRTGRAHISPAYADDPDIMWELLEALITWQDKVAYERAHMIFWFDMLHYAPLIETITNAGWKLAQPFPLIWHKPAQGVASDHRRRPRHVYETALLFSRGDRKIVKVQDDVFSGRVSEKLHMNQKEHNMLRHFLSIIVDEHTAVFDPTCGSGSALAAARSLGAQRVLGVESDESNAEVARYILMRESGSEGTEENE